MSAPDILAVARWLQSRHGCYVFAVDHPGRPECGGAHAECDGQRGKHPRGKWSQLATRDPQIIAAMLAHGPWNIGVAAKRSGLLVVDEDRPGAFTEFAASIGQAVEPTFAVDTAKGRHWYYRQAEGAPLGNGRGALAGRGIDVRGGGSGKGGYVVGPGSVHQTGVVYSPVDSSAPIMLVPAWLVEALTPPAVTQQRATRPVVSLGSLKGLVRVVLEAGEGERNTSLFWASCRAGGMVSEGRIDEATATAVLIAAAIRTGLPEAEALRTVASGLRTTEGVRHG